MPIITDQQGEILIHRAYLSDPNVELDLTSDPWNLLIGQASVVRGLDVIHRGRLAPNGGRKPLSPNIYDSGTGTASAAGFTLTDATKSWPVDGLIGMYVEINGTWYRIWDNTGTVLNLEAAPPNGTQNYTIRRYQLGTLTMAESGDMQGQCGKRWRDVNRADVTDYTLNAGSLVNLISPYAWPADMVGGYIYVQNGQGYDTENHLAEITAISTTAETDDTLEFSPAIPWGTIRSGAKVEVVYPITADKRGIWVSNGRKFWLLHDNEWVLYLDLGHDDYLGAEWHVCRISHQLVMFVHPTYPSRVVRLDVDPDPDGLPQDVADNTSLAGLLAPCKPEKYESNGDDDGNLNKSWFAVDHADAGSITGGVYRIAIRAVNLDDGSESEFVPVYDSADKDDRDITLTASKSCRVFNYLDDSDYQPAVFHERWTHLEIWRTTAGGSAYFLETRIPIVSPANEIDATPTPDSHCMLSYSHAHLTMSDTALAAQTQATANDLAAGKPPPICQRAVSLLGVTICAGKANAARIPVKSWSPNFWIWPGAGGGTWAVGDNKLTQAAKFTNYDYDGNDYLRVLYPSDKAGDYGITSRFDVDSIVVPTGWAGDTGPGILACIARRLYVDWPYIESDEDVWYSRTDKYAPESFQIVNSDGTSRILRVSSIGDILRNLVVVGNYACMVMSKGVHLLYFDGTALAKDTVIAAGGGTPWEKSVVVHDNVVIWARPEGPRVLVVSNEPDSDGHRGRLGWLDPEGRMRKWFEDAYDNGYEIDAGIDSHSGTIRFRRKVDDNTFEVLEYSYLTKRWTLLDDDSGAFYATSMVAGSTEEDDDRLYSLDTAGAVLQENHFGLTHHYDDYTVQDLIETIVDSATGTVADGVLTDNNQDWEPDELIGDMLEIGGLCYQITDNTETTITAPSYTGSGSKTYSVLSAYVNEGFPDTEYTSIVRIGAFSPLMEGDVIRIKLPGASESVSRVIRSASDDYVAFDSITGLEDDDEGATFYIAPMRFCLKWAPLVGRIREAIKTLRDLVVRIMPGPRNLGSGPWPNPPDGKFTLKAWSEYGGDPVDTNEAEIGVWDESDVANKTEDRLSSLEAQGSAITLQLSSEDTRTDFRIELVKAQIEEESDVRLDSSETE